MFKVRKGDMVVVTKGKDRGKKGKVLITQAQGRRIIVEGINMAKKHRRQTRQDQQGGIVSIEMPLSSANVTLFCKSCNRGVRAGFSVLKDGTKARLCKSCKQTL
jgi:large subunit ribosomal protein L24